MKKKKIKILHVAQAAGGVDRYIRMLLKYLDKEKFENILVCSQDFREKDYKNLVDFFEQVKMDRAIGSNDLKAIGEVRRLIKRYNPDIVYMQKTEQKTEQQAGLGMSFCEEEGRITVFRKTLEALEWPSHYRFLYNRKMKQIAVQACGAEESGAHRVGKPDESNSGEIKCMALVRMIYGDSGWDKKMSYRLIGRAFPQQRLVSFKITDAMQIENGRVLTEM